jgi:hypothetical protein
LSLKNDYLGHPQGVDIVLQDGTQVGSFGAQDFVLHPLNATKAIAKTEPITIFFMISPFFKFLIIYLLLMDSYHKVQVHNLANLHSQHK